MMVDLFVESVFVESCAPCAPRPILAKGRHDSVLAYARNDGSMAVGVLCPHDRVLEIPQGIGWALT